MMPKTKNFSLGSDNHSGIHPEILQALVSTNEGHAPSYGTDPLTMDTQKLMKSLFGQSCDVHFVFNGTGANVIALKCLMESHHALICSDMAHIHLDECAAPEKAIGCKVLVLPTTDGKITAAQIAKAIERRGDQHYAQIKVVSITQPTEVGTMYSLQELKDLRKVTKEHNLLLHIDGARFVYAPQALNCDFLQISENLGVDAISFGGTKNGLLFGEAVLMYHPEGQAKLKYVRKQLMHLPSKMRFVAAQFNALLKANLWKEIAARTHRLALMLEGELKVIPELKLLYPVQANSVFVKLPKRIYQRIVKKVFFYVWDEKEYAARLMISYDVTDEDIKYFIEQLKISVAEARNESTTEL